MNEYLQKKKKKKKNRKKCRSGKKRRDDQIFIWPDKINFQLCHQTP